MVALLEGIRVVEVASHGVGPVGAMVLGDFGADVIKIENLEGEITRPTRGIQVWGGEPGVPPGGHSVIFELSNRNKRDITADLSKEKGLEIAYKLIETADVFISNYLTRSLKKLKLDYATLSKINPRLIYATASAWGEKGPDVDKAGFDGMAIARAGLMMACGEPGAPVEIRGMLADNLAGNFLAWSAMAGLLARERTGKGQEITSSLLGTMVWAQYAHMSLFLLHQGKTLPRESRTNTPSPLVNSYICKDGQWLFLMNREWPVVCRALGLESLENDPRFIDETQRTLNCVELINVLDKIFAGKTRDQWVEHFETNKFDLRYSVINSIPDVPNDPQVLANEYIVDYNHRGLGRVKVPQFPVHFSQTPVGPVRRPAPLLGEHTEEVMLELGYSRKEIAELKKQKVI